MTPTRIVTTVFAVATAALALSYGGGSIESGRGFISRAEARIGRPATPLSYAGVARRTTRRAVAVGAAATAGAPAAGAYAYPPGGCAQVVNAYGQVITRCR